MPRRPSRPRSCATVVAVVLAGVVAVVFAESMRPFRPPPGQLGMLTTTEVRVPDAPPFAVDAPVVEKLCIPLLDGTCVVTEDVFSSAPVPKPIPGILLFATDDQTTVRPGDELTATVWITNASDINGSVDVSLALHPLHQFVAFTDLEGTYDAPAQTAHWKSIDVPAWSTRAARVRLTVDPAAPAWTPITLTASRGIPGEVAVDTTTVEASLFSCLEARTSAALSNGLPWAGDPSIFGFTVVPAEGGGTAVAGSWRDGAWRFDGLQPGASYTVSPLLPPGWERLSLSPPDGRVTATSGGGCAQVAMEVRQLLPSLALAVRQSSATITPQGTLVFAIDVQNMSSTLPATGIPVSLWLPGTLAAVMNPSIPSPSHGGSYDGQRVSWMIPQLSPGETRTLLLTVRLHGGPSPGTQLTVRAEVGATPPLERFSSLTVVDPPESLGCISVTSVLKSWRGGSYLGPSPLMSYSLDRGPDVDAPNGAVAFPSVPVGLHTVVERLPAGWIPESVSPPGGAVQVFPGVPCTSVTFTNVERTPAPSAALTHTVSSPAALPGGAVRYSVTVRNTAEVPVPSATLRYPLPPTLRFVAADRNGALGSDGAVEWTLPLILPGESAQVTLDVAIAADAALGSVIATEAQLRGVGQMQTAPASVRVEQQSVPSDGCVRIDLQMTRDPARSALSAPPFAFTIARGGDAPRSAYRVSVRGSQPTEVRDLPVGSSTVRMSAVSGWTPIGPAERTVDVQSDRCVAAAFRVRENAAQPQYLLSVTDDAATANPGQVLPFAVTLVNLSDAQGSNATVEVPLSAAFGFVPGSAADGTYDASTRVVRFTVPVILGNGSQRFSFRVRVDPLLELPQSGTTVHTRAFVVGGPAATDTTVLLPLLPQDGCVRVLTRVLAPAGPVPPPPGAVFGYRVDGNPASLAQAVLGITFLRAPPGLHTVDDVPAAGFTRVFTTPASFLRFPTDRCDMLTFVYASSSSEQSSESSAPPPSCGDGLCSFLPVLSPSGAQSLYIETCATCPADCGSCASSDASDESESVSSSSEPSPSVSSSSDDSTSSSEASSTSSESSLSSTSSISSPNPYLWCDHRMIFPPQCPLYDPLDNSLNDGAVMYVPPYTPVSCTGVCDAAKVLGLCCRPQIGPRGECQEATDQQCTGRMFFPYREDGDCEDALGQGLCGR